MRENIRELRFNRGNGACHTNRLLMQQRRSITCDHFLEKAMGRNLGQGSTLQRHPRGRIHLVWEKESTSGMHCMSMERCILLVAWHLCVSGERTEARTYACMRAIATPLPRPTMGVLERAFPFPPSLCVRHPTSIHHDWSGACMRLV